MEEYFDDNVNEESTGQGGYDLVKPGYYQMRVADLREKDDSFEVDFEVIAGTKASEVGKTHREFISLNSKDMNRRRRLALALACGLVTKEQVKAAREGGSGLSIDYPSATGQHCVVEIEHQAKQKQNEDGEWVDDPSGKINAKIPYDNLWHIDDKTVAKKGVTVDRSKLDDDPFGGPAEAATSVETSDF